MPMDLCCEELLSSDPSSPSSSPSPDLQTHQEYDEKAIHLDKTKLNFTDSTKTSNFGDVQGEPQALSGEKCVCKTSSPVFNVRTMTNTASTVAPIADNTRVCHYNYACTPVNCPQTAVKMEISDSSLIGSSTVRKEGIRTEPAAGNFSPVSTASTCLSSGEFEKVRMSASSSPRSHDVHRGQCQVCGERASGNFFGALVCLPCKSFFIRCTKEGEPVFVSHCEGRCEVSKQGRNRCQQCRYKRCQAAGMSRKEKPETIEPCEGQILCRVCGDIANGIHFGVYTCEGCKKFFRRGLLEFQSYVCKGRMSCTLNPRNRNNCRYCRYQKCINVGMSRKAIKMGRPKKLNRNMDGTQPPASDLNDSNPSDRTLNSASDLSSHSVPSHNEGISEDDAAFSCPILVSSESSSSQKEKRQDMMKTWTSSENVRGVLPLKKGILRSLLSKEESAMLRATGDMGTDDSGGDSCNEVMYFGDINIDSVHEQNSLSNTSSPQWHSQSNSSSFNTDCETPVKMDIDSDHAIIKASRQSCFQLIDVESGKCAPRRQRCKSNSPPLHKAARAAQHAPIGIKRWKSDSDAPTMSCSTAQDIPKDDMCPAVNTEPIKTDTAFKNRSQHTISRSETPLDLSLSNCNCHRVKNFNQNLHITDQHFIQEKETVNTMLIDSQSKLNTVVDSRTKPWNQTPDQLDLVPVSPHSPKVNNFYGPANRVSSSVHEKLEIGKDNAAAGNKVEPGEHVKIFLISREILGDIDNFFLSSLNLLNKIQEVHDHESKCCTIPEVCKHIPTDPLRHPLSMSGHHVTLSCQESETARRLDSEYRFPPVLVCEYWERIKVPPDSVQMSVEQHRILQDMLEAYMEMLKNLDESHIPTNQSFRHITEWPVDDNPQIMEHVVRRIVRQVKEELAFMVKVPGFNQFHPQDRIFIIQNMCFANVTLMAARDWYDPRSRTFRNMLTWKLPESHPMYTFRQNTKVLGDRIQQLKIDRTEAAMMSALNIAASDIRDLKDPEVIEKSRDCLVSALRAHLSYKGVDAVARMRQLFSLMPALRLCGFWTKNLREQIALNRSDSRGKRINVDHLVTDNSRSVP